jgi:hypothetical protein
LIENLVMHVGAGGVTANLEKVRVRTPELTATGTVSGVVTTAQLVLSATKLPDAVETLLLNEVVLSVRLVRQSVPL